MGFGGASKAQIQQQIDNLGTNMIVVTPGATNSPRMVPVQLTVSEKMSIAGIIAVWPVRVSGDE